MSFPSFMRPVLIVGTQYLIPQHENAPEKPVISVLCRPQKKQKEMHYERLKIDQDIRFMSEFRTGIAEYIIVPAAQ